MQALVLAEYLERHRSLVQSKNVLELGAGTGLVGIATAMLGTTNRLTTGFSGFNPAMSLPFKSYAMANTTTFLFEAAR